MTRAQLDKRPADISAMFDAIAGRYDLLNDVLSLGQHRRWRSVVARFVAAGADDLVLDIAAGTGTSSRAFTTSGARCVACDFSLGMLSTGASRLRERAEGESARASRRARRRANRGAVFATRAGGALRAPGGEREGLRERAGRPVSFVAGDALVLPFADQAFDVVTISFGLRNVSDAGAALAEMLRVTRPGGRLVVCEFSHLRSGRFGGRLDAAYQRYLARALPMVARVLSPSSEAYAYLAESIRDWPGQRELADQIASAGWSAVSYRDLTLGVVAVHVGRRPR